MIEQTFEEVFTLEALLKAHKKGRQSKRKKKSIVKFEISMFERIYKLYNEIKTNKYKISAYNSFVVYEPKRREIQTLLYRDRIVQHVLCDDVLMPYFSKRAILDNCVCQIGKGTHFALDRFGAKLKKFVEKNGEKGYVLKCDIHKYFPSISHTELKRIVLKEVKDAKLRAMIEKMIDSYHTNKKYLERHNISTLGDLEKTMRGVPIGNQTSQVFGMFYLNEVDRLIKEKLQVKIYSRYMDDFVIVHQDKNFLEKVLEEIKKVTNKLCLSLNKKTQIFPLKNGITYLGFRFVIKNNKVTKRVSTKTIKRFIARAKLLNRAFADNLIDETKVKQSLNAYHGHLMHGDCFKLEKDLHKRIKINEIKSNRIRLWNN